MDDLCDILEAEILKNKSSEEDKQMLLKRLRTFCNTETNIMLVGATGCGKSSTINALFACGEQAETMEEGGQTEKRKYVEVAKVGSKADPETRDIEKYRIGNLVLWDTPGLGDGTEIDEHHKEVITELLTEEDDVFMCIVALGIIQQYYINTKTATFISKVLAILEKKLRRFPMKYSIKIILKGKIFCFLQQ